MATSIRYLFESGLKRISPPWLRRIAGGAVMEGIGSQIDVEVDRSVEGLRKRFPNAASPDALGFLGRERRILRGPGEPSDVYATRLIGWWDAHRLRGGPYALLTQLYEFFLTSLNVPMQVVGNSGIRHSVDTAGVITRDAITWSGDGGYPAVWARIYIFFALTGTTIDIPLITETGEPVLTEGGEQVLTTISIYAATSADLELFCSVPREWSAAHIDRIYITLLPPGGELWGYPVPVGTWSASDPSPGQVWGGNPVVQFIC